MFPNVDLSKMPFVHTTPDPDLEIMRREESKAFDALKDAFQRAVSLSEAIERIEGKPEPEELPNWADDPTFESAIEQRRAELVDSDPMPDRHYLGGVPISDPTSKHHIAQAVYIAGQLVAQDIIEVGGPDGDFELRFFDAVLTISAGLFRVRHDLPVHER